MNTPTQSDIIHSPGDRFFKAVLGEPIRCADLLRCFVPQLGPYLDVGILRREAEHFVEPNLSEKITDLLFSLRVDDTVILPYLLIEHRGHCSPVTALEVLTYKQRIWSRWTRTHRRRTGEPALAPVVAVILYAGRKPWNVSKQFADLTGEPKGLEANTVRFEYVLVDLSRVDHEKAKAKLWLWMVCGLVRAVATGEVREWMREAAPYWDELLRRERLTGLVETMLRYCVEADIEGTFSTVEDLAANVTSSGTKEQIMSLAEKLIQQGLEQGLEKGLEEGRQEGLEKGTMIGRIQSYQDLLNLKETPVAQLEKLSLNELRSRVRKLQARLHRR